MCTAISLTVNDNYFGRNLDYDHTFGEKVVITPRIYPFTFRNGKCIKAHHAIIGMALPMNNYPLYFDATNEKGLSMAGLNFPENACYNKKSNDKENLASFELIPRVLSVCETVAEARTVMENINITDESFNKATPPSPLHWLIADRHSSITIEQTVSGMHIYENPTGVLTNNPTFDMHLINLSTYSSLSAKEAKNSFCDKLDLSPYCRGTGSIGLPGDLTSMSRFVRACFTKLNSVSGGTEAEAVNQFFHILYSVYQQKGCVRTQDGFVVTNYTSCCNTDKGIYYYTTYNNMCITAVDMHREILDTNCLIIYDLLHSSTFTTQN